MKGIQGILWLSLKDQILPVDNIYQPATHLHVTLQFGVNREEFEHLIGQDVQVLAVANCWNDKIQALRVNLPDKFSQICGNLHPHMTISHGQDVRPVESNNMLNSEHNEQLIQFVMQTTVEFYEFKN